MQVQANLPAS